MEPEFDPGKHPGYLYAEFAEFLAALIARGVLPAGARLPGERDLAAQHGVSIGTARRATRLLRERGLVVTLPAKGTFVATQKAPLPDPSPVCCPPADGLGDDQNPSSP